MAVSDQIEVFRLRDDLPEQFRHQVFEHNENTFV